MNDVLTFQNALYFTGVVQFSILTASALVPVVLDWKTLLQPLPPFLRTLFWVYGAFIVLMIISLATLTLLCAPEMAAGQPVARAVSGVVAVFWGARLLVQLFVFDASAYLTNAWLKLGNHALTVAFTLVTTVHALAAVRPWFVL